MERKYFDFLFFPLLRSAAKAPPSDDILRITCTVVPVQLHVPYFNCRQNDSGKTDSFPSPSLILLFFLDVGRHRPVEIRSTCRYWNVPHPFRRSCDLWLFYSFLVWLPPCAAQDVNK